MKTALAGRAERRLRGARRHQLRRDRPRHRQARAPRLPAGHQRGLPRRAPSRSSLRPAPLPVATDSRLRAAASRPTIARHEPRSLRCARRRRSRAAKRRRWSRSSRPTARRRSASAPRCWSSPTAAPSARSAAAATRTTRSGKAREAICDAQAGHRALRPQRRLRARRTASSAAARWTCYIEPLEPSPRALHHRRRPRRLAPGARSPHEAGFRVHVIDDREKFANTERFPAPPRSSSSRFPTWLHRADIARRRPTSSSSRAATSTISTRCARSRRAICATSA